MQLFVNQRSKYGRFIIPIALLASFIVLSLPAFAIKSPSETDILSFQEFSLNDLRDLGILLHQVQQDTIGIYQEAARTNLKPDADPQLSIFTSIPANTTSKNILPPRQEWLVYFLGAMEPVVRNLGDEVLYIQNGMKKLVIPEPLKPTLNPLWEEWAAGAKKLNENLDTLTPLIDDAGKNGEQIQKVAIDGYNSAANLENIRMRIWKAMQEGKKKYPDAKIMISPP